MPEPSDPTHEVARLHLTVRGRVQGVGFRAFVQASGASLGLTGWVRNVGYDQVETIAEGKRVLLEEFIMKVRQGPRGSLVDDSKLDWESPTGEFSSFNVRSSR